MGMEGDVKASSYKNDGESTHNNPFEPDLGLHYRRRPTAEDYDEYERRFWHKELRKLLRCALQEAAQEQKENQTTETPSGDPSLDNLVPPNSEAEEMDVDSQNVTRVRKHSANQNPLLHPKIIGHVLNFFDCRRDKDTLDNCRQVCDTWNLVCQNKLDHSDPSTSPYKISARLAEIQLHQSDDLQSDLVPKNCHRFNIRLPFKSPQWPADVIKLFEKIGDQIEEFDVDLEEQIQNENDPGLSIQRLGNYLEKFCPHLKKLKLSIAQTGPLQFNYCPKGLFEEVRDDGVEEISAPQIPKSHFLPVKEIDMADFPANSKSGIFSQLISSSPFLESLSFEHEETELIVHVLRLQATAGGGPEGHRGHTNGLTHLKSLEISHSDVHQGFINFALKYRWNLEHLKIGFSSDVSIVQIRAFLTHMRNTLTSLVLLYKGHEEYETADVIGDNWLVPLCMKNLTSLEIAPNIYANACRSLVNALQLPHVKSIKFVNSISWNDNEFGDMWNPSPSPGSSPKRKRSLSGEANRCPWKWKEPTIEIFKMSTGCLDRSIFSQDPNPFRNLKELSCDSPSVRVLQAFFSTLENLERLEVTGIYGTSRYTWDDVVTFELTGELKERALIWDEILTGERKPEYTILYKLKAQPLHLNLSHLPSIQHLSKLKCLSLEFKSLPPYEKVSDFLIYHGLVHLTHLQHVQINQHTFSDEAIECLREKIGPNAHLEFGESELDVAFGENGF